jgi:hypothetical protein
MKLLTSEVIKQFEKHPLGSQEGKGEDAKVLVKFFGGYSYTFLVTEAEKQANGDWLLYGLTTLDGRYWEWGDTLFSEIVSVRFPPFGLPVERDMYSSGTVKELKGE